jgi:hypothetical protein
VLCSDATIATETPPLRAGWLPVKRQAPVPIIGSRSRRVLDGPLSVRPETVWLDEASRWNQDTFQDHLRRVRARWRGWAVVLFVDRGSPHPAKASRALAQAFGIELRFLPTPARS